MFKLTKLAYAIRMAMVFPDYKFPITDEQPEV